jgi:hypothetical protein
VEKVRRGRDLLAVTRELTMNEILAAERETEL